MLMWWRVQILVTLWSIFLTKTAKNILPILLSFHFFANLTHQIQIWPDPPNIIWAWLIFSFYGTFWSELSFCFKKCFMCFKTMFFKVEEVSAASPQPFGGRGGGDSTQRRRNNIPGPGCARAGRRGDRSATEAEERWWHCGSGRGWSYCNLQEQGSVLLFLKMLSFPTHFLYNDLHRWNPGGRAKSTNGNRQTLTLVSEAWI